PGAGWAAGPWPAVAPAEAAGPAVRALEAPGPEPARRPIPPCSTARSSASASLPSSQSLQELPRVRRFRRLRVLRGQLVENRLRLCLAPENAQATPALELRLRNRVAGGILERQALEDLQRAGAVSADFAN